MVGLLVYKSFLHAMAPGFFQLYQGEEVQGGPKNQL